MANNTTDYGDAEIWAMALGIWQIIIACVGTPLNLWILYAWYKHGQSSKHNRIRTSTQVHNHWFVASMTFADLVTTAFHSPCIAAWYVFDVKYSQTFCLSLLAVTHMASTASSLSLLCLNIDKFLYVSHSLHYEQYLTETRAIGATLISWILSITWALVFVTNFMENMEYGCSYSEVETISYIVFSVVFFILPTFLSLATSIHIAVIVAKYMGMPEKQESTPDHHIHHGRRQSQSSQKSGCGAWRKKVAFIFTTTVWTAITCLPYRCIFMLRHGVVSNPFSPLRYIFYGFMDANAVGNPLITLITLKSYRKATAKLLMRCYKNKL